MSSLKPINVWGQHGSTKVGIALEELGFPFEYQPIEFANIKGPEYTKINPNGRLPAIYDPNTDLTPWESGAILEYLAEKYDKDGQLSFKSGTAESYLTKQWLYFQTTGQGPYYGQAIWLGGFHPEKVRSAVERYVNEIKRVTGVLEGHLKKQKEARGTMAGWESVFFRGSDG